MKVLAPGKLILSGEHAVVHGHPALAMAINRYATTTAVSQILPFISFHLSDLAYERRFSLSALDHLKNQIKEKYKRFIHGDFRIRDVLQKPVELAQFAFSLFFETLNLKLTQGIKIRVQSDIPMGCGLGSSAATILSIVHAIAHHLNMDISSERLLHLGLEAENMQHGYSSGLDLQISLKGGCLYWHEGRAFERALPQLPMFLVNTGTPKTSTGECVESVAHHFRNSSLGNDFAQTTQTLDKGLQEKGMSAIFEAISHNHQLLTYIGVVPKTVQSFLNKIMQIGGVGKICGAGAVAGESGGMVLVLLENNVEALLKLCTEYQYELLPVQGVARGVHVI